MMPEKLIWTGLKRVLNAKLRIGDNKKKKRI